MTLKIVLGCPDREVCKSIAAPDVALYIRAFALEIPSLRFPSVPIVTPELSRTLNCF